jgi:PAS domain S-box-containing protein
VTDLQGKTILLVEDEAIIALHEASVLKRYGLSVTPAHTAEQALGALREGAVDLVLMDIDLGPGQPDGIDLAKAIIGEYGTPVIFISNHTEPEIVERAQEVTSYGYVVKNSSESVLIASLRMAFRLHGAYVQILNQEREERFRAQLLDAVSQAIIATELDGRIIYWNNGATRLYGWTAEEALGKKIHEYTVPEVSRQGAEEIMSSLAQGHTWQGEFLVKDKAGRRFYAHVTNAPILDEHGTLSGIIGLSYDASPRREREQRLRQSEELHRMTLKSIGDAVVATDNEGRVFSMNEVAERLTGFSAAEATTRPLSEVFSILNSQNGERLDNPVEQVLATGRVVELSNHTKLIAKDGREFLIADSAAPILDQAGKIHGVVLVFRDETERSLQEKRLRESEETFRRLFESMAQGVVYHDASGAIIRANEAAGRILGLSHDQILGKDSFDPQWRTVDENGAPFPGELHPAMVALRTGKSVERRIMGVYRPEQAEYAWICVSAIPEFREGETRPYRVFATFEDVTAQYRMAEEREKNHRFLQTIFEAIPDFVSVLDPHLQIQQVNGRVRDLYRSQGPIEGKACYRVYHGREGPCENCPSLRARTSKSTENELISVVTADGERRWFDVSAHPVLSADGEITALVEYARDVTKLVNERDATLRELEEKSTLLREIHHRVKNNMSILASLVSLKSRKVRDSEGHGAMREVQSLITSLQRLYDQLYDSDVYGGSPVQSYVQNLIADIGGIYSAGHVAVQTDVAEVVLPPEDVVRLGILVNELVANAVKYAFPDKRTGTVHIRLYLIDDARIELEVSDDGVGFHGGLSELRTKGSGIAIVEALVEQLGGVLRVDGGPGTGARFLVRFKIRESV